MYSDSVMFAAFAACFKNGLTSGGASLKVLGLFDVTGDFLTDFSEGARGLTNGFSFLASFFGT